MMETARKPVGELLNTLPRQRKIKRSAYQESGRFPIVDQSQAAIAGYTNDESWLYQGELPVVVFGDHTRVLKFVDFPFCVGADGTQLLRPVDGNDIRYFYYALRNIDLTNYGYERHFKYLKEERIPTPPPHTQQRIAGILSAYDELIENSQRRIRILETMARNLYREWFVNFRFPGHEAIPRVSSPLGDIPRGWKIGAFTELADVLSGGTPKTDIAEYWNGQIPFFTPRDAPTCFYVQDTDKHVTELGLSKCASELYPPETVFITARGTVGKVSLPSVPMAMNQSCYALHGKAGISQRYLFLLTLQQVDYLKTNTGGATFDTIVVDTFRRMRVLQPPCEVIASFNSQVDAMFEQVNTLQRQIQNLRRTRDLLLPRLLSGQAELQTESA